MQNDLNQRNEEDSRFLRGKCEGERHGKDLNHQGRQGEDRGDGIRRRPKEERQQTARRRPVEESGTQERRRRPAGESGTQEDVVVR